MEEVQPQQAPSPTVRYPLGVIARTALTLAGFAVIQVACSAPASSQPDASGAQQASGSPSLGSAAAPSPSGGATGWRLLPAKGPVPEAREDHTWTLAPDGDAYLFAGRDGGEVYDDLWRYSVASGTWAQVTPTGASPAARFGHNAVWAAGIGLVIFAGQGPDGFFNDLWAFDATTNEWRQLQTSGARPVPRYGSCASIGPDGRLWISHGFTSEGQRFADTRAFDLDTAAWTDETPLGEAPIERCLHACWWTGDDELVLYAGQTTGTTALDDLWHMVVGERPGTNSWARLAPDPAPVARNLHAAARWAAGTLVFGGQGNDDTYLADTWWISDDGTAVRLEIDDALSPRAGAELIADPDHGRLLLFGGRDSTSAFGELWQLVPPSLP